MVLVRLVDLADFSVQLKAYVWAKDNAAAFELKCDVMKSVFDRFNKEGIEVPFPYRTIVYKKDIEESKLRINALKNKIKSLEKKVKRVKKSLKKKGLTYKEQLPNSKGALSLAEHRHRHVWKLWRLFQKAVSNRDSGVEEMSRGKGSIVSLLGREPPVPF